MPYLISLLMAAFLSVNVVSAPGDFPWQKKPNPGSPPSQANRPTPGKPNPGGVSGIPAECLAALASDEYVKLAAEMSRFHYDARVRSLLATAGVDISNVSWQDTGRHHGSSGGNNISDVRLNSLYQDATGKLATLAQPIIRLPNFEDPTVDIDLDQVFVPVGNAWGVKPFAVSLSELLRYLPNFLSWREEIQGSLLLPRDSQVLVGAQASIMPVPKSGQAYFTPSIYNYQSTKEHPAVLTILVTNRGTSITVIDNSRDSIEMFSGTGQMLYHNNSGEKSPFTLEAIEDVSQDRIADLQDSGQSIAGQTGVNQVMLIQVPLKHPPRRIHVPMFALESVGPATYGGATRGMNMGPTRGVSTGVVDVAGFTLGRFTELDGKGMKLERDPNVPIRIDVVRYMASDTTRLSPSDVNRLPEELRGIYKAGSNLGSLVVGDNYDRVTRNHKPWSRPWWPIIVQPYIPRPYWDTPWVFWEDHFGPGWVYRFATEEMARSTVASMEPAAQE